jgi:hypothetical protein
VCSDHTQCPQMGRQAKLAAERRSNPDRSAADKQLTEQIRAVEAKLQELESMLLRWRSWMIEGNEGDVEEELNARDDFESVASVFANVERELSDYLLRTKNAALAAFKTGEGDA